MWITFSQCFCVPGYAVTDECHPSFDPFCSPQLIHTSRFSPLQNGSDPSAGAAADQLDKSNPCQLPQQAQSQMQAPVPQLPGSQRALSASASSCLTQQKQLVGAAGQTPTETSTEVWTDG